MTATVNYRPLQLTDTVALFELIERNREHLRTWFPITLSAIVDEPTCLRYIQKKQVQAQNKEGFCFGIDHPSAGLIGCIIVKTIDWRIPKGELAYYLDHDWKRKGIMSQGIAWICDHLFTQHRFEKVFLQIGPDNPGSLGVARKNGFVQEGLMRQDFRDHLGQLRDIAYLGLTREDWQATTSDSTS